MEFLDSAKAFFYYGIWTLVLFAVTCSVLRIVADLKDLPGWVVPAALVGVLALWLLIPHGWNLLSYWFSGNWDYGNDLRERSISPDDAWFIVKVEFWAALLGTAVGYFGLDALRRKQY
ncbi:hypothetical protein AB3X91_30665 [Paraburkholderia sp. BR14263]|uniref:hypothetical protein n=1 Tax=unclassified Paraburkholderia TaxID=2615204 RepID=UPI0034CF0C08